MKVLALYSEGFRLYADSSAHRDRHPLFLPDVEQGWMIYICPCVRISRLGMNIAQEFAHRYYDSIGIATILLPSCENPDFATLGEQYFAMDSAFTVSDMFPSDENINVKAFGQEFNFNSATLEADKAVSDLSGFMTFKTGDLLFFTHKSNIIAHIAEGDEVIAYINNQLSLDVKIK